MQWARYNLFLLLCLVLAYSATLFPESTYPFGFHNQQLVDSILPILQHKLSNWDIGSLKVLLSYLLGVPLRGQLELNLAHANLNLSHLLSPSAFHLLSISWLLTKLLPKIYLQIFWLTLLFITYFYLPIHPALSRSLSLCLVMTFVRDNADYQKAYLLFLALGLDYFVGSYKLMPLSYIFSFIILGNLILLPKQWSMRLKLFTAQFHLMLLFSLKFQLLNFILGFYLGILFLPIFTSLIIYIFLTPGYNTLISNFLENVFNLFLLTIQKLSLLLLQNNPFTTTDNLVFLFLTLSLIYRKSILFPFFALAILLPQT